MVWRRSFPLSYQKPLHFRYMFQKSQFLRFSYRRYLNELFLLNLYHHVREEKREGRFGSPPTDSFLFSFPVSNSEDGSQVSLSAQENRFYKSPSDAPPRQKVHASSRQDYNTNGIRRISNTRAASNAVTATVILYMFFSPNFLPNVLCRLILKILPPSSG
jgi:hypothetical protein